MTEDEMENLPAPTKVEAVAIDEKHACITVVVPSHSKASTKIDPSPSSVIEKRTDAEKFGAGYSGFEDGNGNIIVGGVKAVDKINNIVQKEIALGRVGVTREKAYRVIAQALDAHKWMDVIDKQGNIKQEWCADLDKQRWGAEMAIKMFGDMIERKEIEMDVGDKTLDRLRALSVSELKARAADLLLGKKGMIVDAEVVRG